LDLQSQFYLGKVITLWTTKTVTGWWYTYPSEKMMEFVSWDDYSQIYGGKNVPNHQPVQFVGMSTIIPGNTKSPWFRQVRLEQPHGFSHQNPIESLLYT